VCLHCKGDHPTGFKFCPRRLFIERKANSLEKAQKQRTFAEMLRDLEGDEPDMPGENSEKYAEPLKFGNIRKRLYDREFPEMKRAKFQSAKKPKRDEIPGMKETPAGFKATQYIKNDDNILLFLYSFVDKLGFGPAINNIIKELVVPIIYQIIQNAIGTLTETLKSSFTSAANETTSPYDKFTSTLTTHTSPLNNVVPIEI
jgi:hypothetical protein